MPTEGQNSTKLQAESALRDAACSTLSVCLNPISHFGKPVPIQSVLRILAGQEGCNGHPWDQMIQAADYIDFLQQNAEHIHPESKPNDHE